MRPRASRAAPGTWAFCPYRTPALPIWMVMAASTSCYSPIPYTPSQQAARQEQEILLAEALARLPSDYREVIVLRNLEGLPHVEVARRMGRSPGAVRMLWVRALAQMRAELPGG